MTQTARAAIWMTGAIASFTSMAIAGRAISVDLDTFEIMLYRSLIGLTIVLSIASLAGTRAQIRTNKLGLHILRNLAHFIGQNLWFLALTLVPLAQVFALEFTTPLWVILIAPVILKERMTPVGLIAAGIGFSGILIITRPGSAPFEPGLAFAAVAAIGFAFSVVLTRRLTRTESITCVLFWLTFLQACFGLICAGYDGDIALPALSSAPWIVVIGCAGLLAHFCLTNALAIAPAATVVPLDFARLPIIAIVGALVYDEPLDPWVFVGAGLIFAAIYLNITRGQPLQRSVPQK